MNLSDSTSSWATTPRKSMSYSTDNRYLDAYLDRMIEILRPQVSEEQCERLWLETADHLEHLVSRYTADGLSTEMATIRATELYGKADFAATEFIHNWVDRSGTNGLTRRFGRANMTAFAWFAMAQLFYVVILQVTVFLPDGAPLAMPFSPAHVRAIWPEPLPFPTFSFAFALQVGYPLIAPLVAGWLVGRSVPSRASSAVYQALIPLVLYSFVIGALLLPSTTALLFALFEVAFWLPMGCLTAHLSSMLARLSKKRASVRSEF